MGALLLPVIQGHLLVVLDRELSYTFSGPPSSILGSAKTGDLVDEISLLCGISTVSAVSYVAMAQ